MTDSLLVLGPVLRYVDKTSASIWLEARQRCTVTVEAAGRSWQTATFCVHGHHYALVEVDGLEPGSVQAYAVTLDDTPVWPPDDSAYPPSRIATLKDDRDVRIAFGSCRTSVSHDARGNRSHGVDAMRAYALHMASHADERWPDLVLFLGDQVYADETSEAMQRFIAARRDPTIPPGEELKDFEEYCYLYKLAWSDPANRWLLSTLPSAMIFDDHDIRDDWNTSATWRAEIAKTPWWQQRIVGGLGSYWVYQHLGNLSPAERENDEMWSRITAARQSGEEPDFGAELDELADRANQHPETYRWSYARTIGNSRLIVIDSRNARVLTPDHRSILDEGERVWLDEQMRGDVDHVLVGTSLPFLLSFGLHQFEAWNEAVCEGAWGERAARIGERVRQAVDFEHWGAFQEGFRDLARMATELADGERGPAPATILFLSGDVHNSYVSEVQRDGGSRIVQAVCSPIRNPLPRSIRYVSAFSSKNVGQGVGTFFARRAGVADPPFTWDTVRGPWFDNNLATLETDGRNLKLRWDTGYIVDGQHDAPRLGRVADVDIRPNDRR